MIGPEDSPVRIVNRSPSEIEVGMMRFFSSMLETYRVRYGQGDKFSLMHAIGICAAFRLTIPAWAAQAYWDAFDKARSSQVKSWDEAFGPLFPLGFHVERSWRRMVLAPAIFMRVLEIFRKKDRPPLDDGFFESVGAEFGIGKSLCKELFYLEKADWEGEGLPWPPYL